MVNMNAVADYSDTILSNPADFLCALAEHERQAAALALAARRLEGLGVWAADGSVSMAAWLRNHGRMSNAAVHRVLQRGRFLDTFGAVADAALTSTLSAGQVDALAAATSRRREPVLAEQQADLVGILAPLSVADTQAACALWRQRADAIIADGKPPAEPTQSLRFGRADDGALVGSLELHDAAAEEFETAIEIAITYDGDTETRSQAQRQADALHDICAFYNKNHDGDGTPRHRPHVTINADAESLRTVPYGTNTNTGRIMETGCVDTALCDCKLHGILRAANGAPESFGRAARSVPQNLFAQVAARDGGCRMPGCNRKVRHCDAHHIRYWRHGGRTDYDNLALFCSRHHHQIHRQHWEVKLLPSGELHVTLPDGRELISQPRGRPPSLPYR
jgi:hypothetical protein